MQGLYIKFRRPKSKAEVRRTIQAGNAADLSLEATSLFGDEYDGSVVDAPDGEYHFVGPDPYNSRKFYGTLTVAGGQVKVK